MWTLEKKGLKPDINISWDDAKPTFTHMAIARLVQSSQMALRGANFWLAICPFIWKILMAHQQLIFVFTRGLCGFDPKSFTHSRQNKSGIMKSLKSGSPEKKNTFFWWFYGFLFGFFLGFFGRTIDFFIFLSLYLSILTSIIISFFYT